MTSRTSNELRAGTACLVGFLLLTLWVTLEGALPGEARLLAEVRGRGTMPAAYGDFETFMGVLGTPTMGVVVTVVAAAIAWRNAGLKAALLLLGAAAIVPLERPIADRVGHTEAAIEAGFPAGGYPSGHMLYATAVFGALVVLGRRHGRPELVVVGVAVIAATAFTRLYSASHLVDEVLAAALLGGAWLCLVLAVSRRAS